LSSPTSWVYSHYERTVADLPWAEIPVHLSLTVRRFFCDQAACPRKIFVERLGEAIAVYARRAQRLKSRLAGLAFWLGGEAGA
jgi:transposase